MPLHKDAADKIVWNLTGSGEYSSSSSAYKAQFFGALRPNMNKVVWKVWAPPKVKLFAWLAIQNRLWTADRLEKRGCKQTMETAAHLFFQCRLSKRV